MSDERVMVPHRRYSLSVKAAADYLGLHESLIYRLAHSEQIAHLRVSAELHRRTAKGQLQPYRRTGQLRFAPEDLDAWAARHRVEATNLPTETRAAAPSREVEPLPLPARRRFR